MAVQSIRSFPVYVINLDRRPDRWADFSKQPTLSYFSSLQRFSAVDGSKLDVKTDPHISLHTRQNILKKYRRSDYEINTMGAIGASLSHIGIWKAFLDSDASHIIVLEDDTLVTEKNLQMIEALLPTQPAGWDMWLLGCHAWRCKTKPLGPTLQGWQSVQEFTGAHAYILSRRGAEILTADPFPIETHIEYYISGCSLFKGLKIIKHSDLRIQYAAELTEEDDSDTFDTRKSCPVCVVPDPMTEHGFYMSYNYMWRAMVGAAALSAVALGAFLGAKRRG